MSIGNESTIPQNKSGCGNVGCVGGCLIVAGILVVIGLCGGGGIYFWASSQLAKYTAEEPVELPTVELPAADLAKLESRLNTFKEAVEEKAEAQGDLVLTADEINALISRNKETRGKIFVRIEEGQIGGDVSIPLDQVPGGKGRYFNGSVTFDVSMEMAY